MFLLRYPKFPRCLTADAGNFDRGHSLTSLHLPPAALSSLPTASVRTGFAMTGGVQGVRCKRANSHFIFPEKTNTAPTAVKDDALHRGTTLLRRPLTQNGLTECRYTPALSRAPPFGSEAAPRPSTRRLRSHVPPSVPRPLSPAQALFGGLK